MATWVATPNNKGRCPFDQREHSEKSRALIGGNKFVLGGMHQATPFICINLVTWEWTFCQFQRSCHKFKATKAPFPCCVFVVEYFVSGQTFLWMMWCFSLKWLVRKWRWNSVFSECDGFFLSAGVQLMADKWWPPFLQEGNSATSLSFVRPLKRADSVTEQSAPSTICTHTQCFAIFIGDWRFTKKDGHLFCCLN